MRGSQWCYVHDPALEETRRRNNARGGRRGGRGRPQAELGGIKARLSKLADDVLAGEVDKGVAAVASQVLNVYLRAIATELKVREVTELEERLAALEGAKGEARPWGA